MRMKITDKEGTYTTGPVKRIIKRYLKIIGVSWEEFWEKLIIPNVRITFLLAIKDFNEAKISLDQLSTIGDYLYYNDNKWSPWKFDLSDSALGKALGDASELAYYHWRKDKNPQTMKLYKGALKTVREYYQKNKNLLKNFP